MRKNCLAAVQIERALRRAFPGIVIYVPGTHETFIQIAYDKGYLTIEQILNVDCAIIDKCDAMLLYAPDDVIYGGCKVEMEHVIKTHKPYIEFCCVEEAEVQLREFLDE